MSRKIDPMKIEIPDVVGDPNTGRKYRKGKFLGRVSCLCNWYFFGTFLVLDR